MQVGKNAIAIRGEAIDEKRKDKGFATIQESFQETIKLPASVEPALAKATVKDNELIVVVPKAAGIAQGGEGASPQKKWQ